MSAAITLNQDRLVDIAERLSGLHGYGFVVKCAITFFASASGTLAMWLDGGAQSSLQIAWFPAAVSVVTILILSFFTSIVKLYTVRSSTATTRSAQDTTKFEMLIAGLERLLESERSHHSQVLKDEREHYERREAELRESRHDLAMMAQAYRDRLFNLREKGRISEEEARVEYLERASVKIKQPGLDDD